MKNSIVIIGAGGHGKVVADTALLCGYSKVIFLDDSDNCSVKVSGKTSDYTKYVNDCDFFIAIGNNTVRESITNNITNNGADIAIVIHPSAVVGRNVNIGVGSFVAAGSVINTDTNIGRGTILNTCCSVDHDCTVEDYCHISVGSHLAGTVKVGKKTFVGAGATVINNISICDDCTIGAGAVVVKNITDKGTYVGVPAKKIKT